LPAFRDTIVGMRKLASKIDRDDLKRLGPQAAQEAVLRDLDAGVSVEGGARFRDGDESAIVLTRLSPDGRLRMVRAAKAGMLSNG
jgi:hypothetical protein